MVSRMDDARSVQRGAPSGAAVANSKRVRHSEHANQVTHADHLTRSQHRVQSEQQTRESQAACWPVTTWVAAGGGALERVELPLSLLQQPSCLFLLGPLGCNDSCSVVD